MKIVPGQANDQEKLKTPNEFSASGELKEADFIDVCHLVSEICHSPVTLVSIMDADRQWFRSHHPLITAGLVADFAFCQQALHHPKEIFIIADLLKDYRFCNHLLVTSVPYVAFYCGVPLVSPEGAVLGTLCIWDNKARELSQSQISALRSLAHQVATGMELRKELAQLAQKVKTQATAYTELESFTTIAAHDLKGPLNAIISLTDLLRNNYAESLDEEGAEYVNFLYTAALGLADLVTSVLSYSRRSYLLTEQKEDINVPELISEIAMLFEIPPNTVISYEKSGKVIHTNRTALKQILMNLLDNAIKYSDKENIHIGISFAEDHDACTLSVQDNGVGIPKEGREKIFELFKRLPNKTNDSKGMGVGLAVTKKLAEKLGGKITVESEPGVGSTFIVTLPK